MDGAGRGEEGAGSSHDGRIQSALCEGVAQVHREQLQICLVHRLKVGASEFVHSLQLIKVEFLPFKGVVTFG